MNRFGIALLALALAATAGGGARLAAADTLPVTAPLVLEYEGSPREGKTHYLIRILQLTPALRAEWEEGFKLGAFAIDGGTLAGSRQYLRLSALENGRDIKLTGTLNLLSQALYDELAGGRRVALSLHLLHPPSPPETASDAPTSSCGSGTSLSACGTPPPTTPSA